MNCHRQGSWRINEDQVLGEKIHFGMCTRLAVAAHSKTIAVGFGTGVIGGAEAKIWRSLGARLTLGMQYSHVFAVQMRRTCIPLTEVQTMPPVSLSLAEVQAKCKCCILVTKPLVACPLCIRHTYPTYP